ncbi:MAG: rubredoxin [Oscillospiraceae bacterium]|nr:rubredoxin [Oscillospiraceae bacterium]
MKKCQCTLCDNIFDKVQGCPDQGISPKTSWEDIQENFVCPDCSAGKDMFEFISN